MTWRDWPAMMTLSPRPPVSVSATVASRSRLSRRWSRVAISRLAPSLTLPLSGCERAGEKIDQRCLAGAVGSDERDAVAALDPQSSGRGRSCARRSSWRSPRPRSRACRRPWWSAPPASRCRPDGWRGPRVRARRKSWSCAKPALVALPPRGDAVAEPVLLVGDPAVELVAVAFLFLQHLVAPGLEIGEAAIEPPRHAAVEPHRRLATGSRGSAGHG